MVAFAIIYFVWGSTFFAIRIGVHAMPPLLFAAMRFVAAGAVLTGWMVARREPLPSKREWMSLLLLAFLIFLVDYGLLFWAEQRVPSGMTAVMMATIPAFIALAEIFFLRTLRLTTRLGAALLIGIAGVGVLLSHSLNLGGAALDTRGAFALITGGISWSVASVLSKKLPLPASKVQSSGLQMLLGGVLLTLTAASLGEFREFHPSSIPVHAWMALFYLTVFGSIIGFTAYVWLIHHESPTKVGTYAYVNPVVAVLLGYFAGGEALGVRSVIGTVCVLISIVVITTTRAKG